MLLPPPPPPPPPPPSSAQSRKCTPLSRTALPPWLPAVDLSSLASLSLPSTTPASAVTLRVGAPPCSISAASSSDSSSCTGGRLVWDRMNSEKLAMRGSRTGWSWSWSSVSACCLQSASASSRLLNTSSSAMSSGNEKARCICHGDCDRSCSSVSALVDAAAMGIAASESYVSDLGIVSESIRPSPRPPGRQSDSDPMLSALLIATSSMPLPFLPASSVLKSPASSSPVTAQSLSKPRSIRDPSSSFLSVPAHSGTSPSPIITSPCSPALVPVSSATPPVSTLVAAAMAASSSDLSSSSSSVSIGPSSSPASFPVKCAPSSWAATAGPTNSPSCLCSSASCVLTFLRRASYSKGRS